MHVCRPTGKCGFRVVVAASLLAPIAARADIVNECRSTDEVEQASCNAFLRVFLSNLAWDCPEVAASGGCPRSALGGLALLCVGGFALTLALQRYVAGT